MEFILGFLGALVCMLLVAASVALGWKLKSLDTQRTHVVTAEALTPEQKRQIEEEQKAWTTMQNYNAMDAYGMYPSTAREG